MDAFYYIDKIDLVKYLIKVGYELDKEKSTMRQKVYEQNGEKLLVLKHRKTGKYIYQNLNDSKDKGNIINFVVNRINGYLSTESKSKQDYAKAFSLLDEGLDNGMVIKNERRDIEKVSFKYELFSPHELTDYSFLLKRGIRKDVIEHPLFLGSIVNCYKYGYSTMSNYGSIMTGFPCIREKNVVGLELRNLEEKKMALGSQVVDSFWVSNYFKSHRNIVLTENPIDNLSYFQLKGDQRSTHVSSFGTISHAQCRRLYTLIKNGIYDSITLCNDNDLGGFKNDLKILACFIPDDHFEIISFDKNSVNVKIMGETTVLKNKDLFKWTLQRLISQNDLINVIYLDKPNAKDWNAELLGEVSTK